MKQITDMQFDDDGGCVATVDDLPPRNILAMSQEEFRQELRAIRQERRSARIAEILAAEADIGGMLEENEVYEYHPPLWDCIEQRLQGVGG